MRSLSSVCGLMFLLLLMAFPCTEPRDQTDPVITECPTNFNVSTDIGQTFATVNWAHPNATDNVGVTQWWSSHTPPVIMELGVTSVEYRAADNAGNFDQCSFSVTVLDREAPVTVCPSDITVPTDQTANTYTVPLTLVTQMSELAVPGSGGTQWIVSDAQFQNARVDDWHPLSCGWDATDNVEVVRATYNRTFNTSLSVGTHHFLCSVFDATNNTATCSFSVTVVDVEPPVVAECPSGVHVGISTGNLTHGQATWTPPTFTDNVGMALVNSTHSPGVVLPIGVWWVRYDGWDQTGLHAECQFFIHVHPWPQSHHSSFTHLWPEDGTYEITENDPSSLSEEPYRWIVPVPQMHVITFESLPIECSQIGHGDLQRQPFLDTQEITFSDQRVVLPERYTPKRRPDSHRDGHMRSVSLRVRLCSTHTRQIGAAQSEVALASSSDPYGHAELEFPSGWRLGGDDDAGSAVYVSDQWFSFLYAQSAVGFYYSNVATEALSIRVFSSANVLLSAQTLTGDQLGDMVNAPSTNATEATGTSGFFSYSDTGDTPSIGKVHISAFYGNYSASVQSRTCIDDVMFGRVGPRLRTVFA